MNTTRIQEEYMRCLLRQPARKKKCFKQRWQGYYSKMGTATMKS